MSEPADEAAPPALAPRRLDRRVLAAAAVLVAIVAVSAATPFWAPAVMQLLPWGQPTPGPAPVPAPAAPDPGLAAARADAGRNDAAVRQLGQRVAALEARPAPDLSAIQQQLAALAKTTSELTASVAALGKTVAAQPKGDPAATALALVLLQIRDAVELARPFDAEYQALVGLAHDHPAIAAAAEPLAGPAASGVASRMALAERLRQLAPQIATARPPPKPSWKSQIVARLRSLVTIRRIDGDAQSPAEAAVSAAERDMASGDLAGAVDVLAGLTGANAAAAQPWLQMARQRLAVDAALRRVEAAVTAELGAPH